MLKKLFILIMVAVFITMFSTLSSAATPVTNHKIVIDPGHGGSDLGSTACAGLPEKEVNLQIAQKLYTLLNNDGAKVYLTRTEDGYKSNADRYNFANSVKGEVLVSIHLNGSDIKDKDGTMGLYGKLRKDKAFTEIIHKRLAKELGIPDLGITNFASGVLLKSNMPATIQETVFISNTDECNRFKDGTGQRQQQIAQSLSNGLNDWFGGSR